MGEDDITHFMHNLLGKIPFNDSSINGETGNSFHALLLWM